MPTIAITDTSSVTVDATVLDKSLLGKTPGSALRFVRSDVVGALNQTLDQVQIKSLTMSFSYQPSFTLAGGSATLGAGISPGGEIDLLKPSDSLFPQDQFGTSIDMKGNYYLALSFNLTPSVTPGGTPGAFTLSLAASATATAALYLPFGKSAAGAFPTLKSSLETLLSSYKLPTQVSDCMAWPVGTVFTFDCQGSLAFTGSINMLAAVNPTASPSFSTTSGPFTLTAGPSITFSGGFTLSGEFEARIWKRDDNTLQLGYYKKTGKTITVGFDAAAGADVEVGTSDVLAKLYGLLGDKGKLDKDWLKQHVREDQADDVAAAYKAAVEQKLSVEINAECDTTFTDQAAFSWNFDVRTDGSAAQQALTDALKGKVTPLLQGAALPAGVTTAGSILDRIREKKRTFNFNFLGLYDYGTVNDAVVDLQVKYTEDGQLILTDTAHIKRLAAQSTPFVKADKLRQVFVEDGTATISYAASFGKFVPQLTVAYTYYEYEGRAKSADLGLFLQIAKMVLGADASAPWTAILGSGAGSQSASLYAGLKYDSATSAALFVDGNGNPRPGTDFRAACRQALLTTPGLGLNGAFLNDIRSDQTWQDLLNAGSEQAILQVLKVDLSEPPMWARIATNWIAQTAFWSGKMHSAGQALQAVTQYLAQHPEADPTKDTEFQKLRKAFANHVAGAIQGAPLFDDAFALNTLMLASKPASEAVSITYAGKTVTYP